MTNKDILWAILDEKRKTIANDDELTKWFWDVGFRNIRVSNDAKRITCFVMRPNKFIGDYNKKTINFLRQVKRLFIRMDFEFRLCKYNDDAYYTMYSEYMRNIEREERKTK